MDTADNTLKLNRATLDASGLTAARTFLLPDRAGELQTVPPGLCQGRATLTSGTPVTTTDVAGAGSIYFTPCEGNLVSIYDGTRWKAYSFSEKTCSLSGLTSGNLYDLYTYWDGSQVLFGKGVAWASATSRGTGAGTAELELFEGAMVNKVSNNGIAARQGVFVSTFRATGTGTTEDSAAKRFLWNYYNRVPYEDLAFDTTDFWTYNGNGTWRGINNAAAAWKKEFVVGWDDRSFAGQVDLTTLNNYYHAVALDSTSAIDRAKTTPGGHTAASCAVTTSSRWAGPPGVGYHYFQGLETSATAASATAYGDNGGAVGSGSSPMNSAFRTFGWR